MIIHWRGAQHLAVWSVFDRWFDRYRWAGCLVSGLLLVAGFAPFSCSTCGWIALVPAWWIITRSEKVCQRPMRYGYLVGLVYFGGVFWWISNVTAIGTFFLVLYLALYPACWFLFVARLIPRTANPTALAVLGQALVAAALWVMLEWWRSWCFTGFNWNELGISQATSIVYRQLAAYGGVHLISFLLVTVNVLWAEGVLGIIAIARERRVVRASGPFALALLLAAASFALGWHHLRRHDGETRGPSMTFACVQPNIPQIPYDPNQPRRAYEMSESDALDKIEKLTLSAITAPVKPRLLVWPEAMISQGVFQDQPLTEAVREITQAYDGYFLLGDQDLRYASAPGERAHLYNAAVLFRPHGDEYQEYRKTRLVMLGEFLPFGDTFPILRQWTGIGLDFTPGPGPVVFALQEPPIRIAPLICFEDTLPEVAGKTIPLRPDFFVTITDDAWYTGWYAQWGVRQHLSHAIFRCIEHDRPMLRCANNGISCLIDQNGTVASRFTAPDGRDIDVGGVFAGTLSFFPIHATPYEMGGDWIVLISALVSVMLGVWFLLRADES
jgi:apolipoprotein N-acyltransferase